MAYTLCFHSTCCPTHPLQPSFFPAASSLSQQHGHMDSAAGMGRIPLSCSDSTRCSAGPDQSGKDPAHIHRPYPLADQISHPGLRQPFWRQDFYRQPGHSLSYLRLVLNGHQRNCSSCGLSSYAFCPLPFENISRSFLSFPFRPLYFFYPSFYRPVSDCCRPHCESGAFSYGGNSLFPPRHFLSFSFFSVWPLSSFPIGCGEVLKYLFSDTSAVLFMITGRNGGILPVRQVLFWILMRFVRLLPQWSPGPWMSCL